MKKYTMVVNEGVMMKEPITEEWVQEVKGKNHLIKQINYADGSRFSKQFNEKEELVALRSYDANGVPEIQVNFEYAYCMEWDDYYKAKVTIIYEDGSKSIVKYNKYGWIMHYDMLREDGSIVCSESYDYSDEISFCAVEETIYDDNRNIMKDYILGRLYKVYACRVHEDGSRLNFFDICRIPEMGMSETHYNEMAEMGCHYDCEERLSYNLYTYGKGGKYYNKRLISLNDRGSKICVEFNEDGWELIRNEFEADGNLIYSSRYDYGYNEKGKIEWIRYYVLSEDKRFYLKKETEYLENGGIIKRGYDESGEQISEIEYDAIRDEI